MKRLGRARLFVTLALCAGLAAAACGGLDDRVVVNGATSGSSGAGTASNSQAGTAGVTANGGSNGGGSSSKAGSSSQSDAGTSTGGTTVTGMAGAPSNDAGAPSAAGTPNEAGAALGTACTSGNECASTHCSDGVCCDQACSGPCAQCSATGKCTAPADDATCPVVNCNVGSNECLSYQTQITDARCKSVGVCKSAGDCAASPVSARTACNTAGSNFTLCNAAGACVSPVVKCGGTDCTIGTKVCCQRLTNGVSSQTCDNVADCPETYPAAEPARTPTECDEHTDCRSGYLCSYVGASGGSHTYCVLAADANKDSAYADWYEVCQSPAKTNTCSGGRACTVTTPAFPGWKFCAHLATD